MEILNLYACLGGNRYKWSDEHNVTAVELDPELARLYKERFPNDNVIVADAHEYLKNNYYKFDFIWSSPPCPKNSRARFWKSKPNKKIKPVFPDLRLYEEVIFLKHYFKGLYCVENVIPYYKPFLPAKKRGRHLYWTNFALPPALSSRVSPVGADKNEVKKLCKFHDFDFYKYKGNQRLDKIARNLVDYKAGETILNAAIKAMESKRLVQASMF